MSRKLQQVLCKQIIHYTGFSLVLYKELAQYFVKAIKMTFELAACEEDLLDPHFCCIRLKRKKNLPEELEIINQFSASNIKSILKLCM